NAKRKQNTMIRSILLATGFLLAFAGPCQAQGDAPPDQKPDFRIDPDGKIKIILTEEQLRKMRLLDRHPPRPALNWHFLNLPIISLVFCLMVIFHEFGHATCAWLVGWRVFRISLGWGTSPMWRFRLAGVQWDIHLLPMSGFVVCSPKDPSHYRLKSFFIYF